MINCTINKSDKVEPVRLYNNDALSTPLSDDNSGGTFVKNHYKKKKLDEESLHLQISLNDNKAGNNKSTENSTVSSQMTNYYQIHNTKNTDSDNKNGQAPIMTTHHHNNINFNDNHIEFANITNKIKESPARRNDRSLYSNINRTGSIKLKERKEKSEYTKPLPYHSNSNGHPLNNHNGIILY